MAEQYEVQEIAGTPGEIEEISAFLAAFVRDGELPAPHPGETEPALWKHRLEQWWTFNPSARDSAFLGYALRSATGELVGFSGFIPRLYTLNGQTVPGLIATTFFVRAAHRNAALGLFLRSRRLMERYHLVDGTPSPEVVKLLRRFGYEERDHATRHLIPVTRTGLPFALPFGPARSRGAGHSTDCPGEGRLVSDPEFIATIPERNGSILHPRVSRESLRWLLDAAGPDRHFVAWCDSRGRLLAYLMGDLIRRKSLRFWQILEYGSFDRSETAVYDLLSHLASARREPNRPRGLHAIAFHAMDDRAPVPRLAVWSKEVPRRCFFSLPPSVKAVAKRCHYTDSDSPFLTAA